MAFFKFRKSGDQPPAKPVQPDSVETLRQRAKYRLIGAAVLVFVGVIGFPMLFDKQPRPIALDLPIDIPDKNKAAPLAIPASPDIAGVSPEVAAPAIAAVPALPVAPAVQPAPAAPVAAVEKPVPVPKAEVKVTPPVTVVPPPPAATPKKEPPPANRDDDGAKARALLEGRNPVKKEVASEGRFVVQVGAFSDVVRAREVRQKVESAGLKTYTQVLDANGKSVTRVRVGPFALKAEADKAAEKIKKLDLPASVLTL